MTTSEVQATQAFPNLADPATFADAVPYEAFARMQELPGLHWNPTEAATRNGGFWAVTRWDDIVAVEKDTETFTSTKGGAYPMMFIPNLDEGRTLMATDPPVHTRLRRAAAKGFGPRVVANFEPWVRDIIAPVMDHIATLHEFDYVKEVAQTIPARVVARVLGMPEEDEEQMVEWALAVFAALQPNADNSAFSNMMKAHKEIAAYAVKVQQVKRDNPADDMFTELGLCVERGEISQDEFVHWMFLMMSAGFETTHTAIGQSMRLYAESADIGEKVNRAVAEGLTGRVVDEFLRLISPPMEMARVATTDTEIAGQQISKDDVMVLYFAAANRDPRKFQDPNEFDPWRAEKETLAFGSGVHRCIGAYLAHLEVRVLWEEIIKRGLMFETAADPKRGWSVFINQLTELPLKRIA
ncbi:cytochrome P450 [Arthrobacter sp. W4I7]|uniref:cytochrome P450 n=1 Tax=Arthrobacter sp. W4I7 TaxID=3042296 RepID=UPI0027814080|nr:cytochrome P450 [Arthrobacter sp. W4I7]MDQ0691333.1 cholest-4-en-3-one 26-monooxygenase [Arthrobacter sp. W4I7]